MRLSEYYARLRKQGQIPNEKHKGNKGVLSGFRAVKRLEAECRQQGEQELERQRAHEREAAARLSPPVGGGPSIEELQLALMAQALGLNSSD